MNPEERAASTFAEKTEDDKTLQGDQSKSSEKLQGAMIGALVTLFLTLLVTSIQFLLFSFPSQLLSVTTERRQFESDLNAKVGKEDFLVDQINQIVKRRDQRETRLLRIRSFKDVQAAETLDGKLGALRQILEDKGTIEGALDANSAANSPAFSILQSLDREEQIWNFMLDATTKDSPEKFLREVVQVVEPTHRIVASATLWQNDLKKDIYDASIQLQKLNHRLTLLYWKALIALAFTVTSIVLGVAYGRKFVRQLTT